MSDFEAPLWRAVRSVFGSNVTHKGCVFHWTQAVWRHMQQLSMAAAYLSRASVHRYCRHLLSLPFLPESAIPEAIQDIKDRTETVQLKSLIGYVKSMWIDSTLWPPAAWSVYKSSVRTNNDCESWHAHLNRKASTGNLPRYKLIDLLHCNAKIVEINMRLMSETKLLRFQRKSTAHIET